MVDTPAHDGKQTHHYTVHFPEHSARPDDPHYKDFDHYHKRYRSTARCYVGERIGFDWCRDAQGVLASIDANGVQSGLELHHAHVEYALQNGVNLTALEADYPGISNPDELGAWVESGTNFRWLCVTEGSPVLMADGSTRPIENILPGDWVVGKDGFSYPVTTVGRKRYSGEVVRFGPTSLTPEHRLLTGSGWSSAGQVSHEIGVHGAEVVRLRCEQQQILSFAPVGSSVELVATDDARIEMGWIAAVPVRALFTGWVHDISVAHSHSFITGGLVAHNCVWHHRAGAGAHTASHSDWEAGQYVPGLIIP